MWKLLIWIPLLLVGALTNNMAHATVYIIASTGSDANDCLPANPCATSTRTYSFAVRGDTVGWIPSATMYTSTGNPGAHPGGITAATFLPDNSNYITLIGLGDRNTADGWGDIRWATSSVIFNGYPEPFSVDKSSYIVMKNFYSVDNDGAMPIRDSNHIKMIKIGMKNPTPHASQYTSGVGLNSASDAGQIYGTSNCLLEDVWVIGEARYSVLVGGTLGFSENNILRRVVVRWDGNSGNQPSAGISIYGETGGVDGARHAWLQNCLVIDSNADSFKVGANLYGMIYLPHSVTRVNVHDSIVFANAGGYGTIPGEDSASSNTINNSLFFGQTGPGIFTNSVNITSTTVRGNTIGWTSGAGFDHNGGSGYRFENNQYFRLGGAVDAADVDDFNGYFPSTANTAGSTNENTNDPSMTIGSSVNPTSTQYGGGLGGKNIGCTIDFKRGKNGTLKDDVGWNDIQTDQPVFPWPYEAQLKGLMAKQDTGDAATNNSANNETRGWAGSAVALADYTYAGVKLGVAANAQAESDPAQQIRNIEMRGTIEYRNSLQIR